MRNRKSSAPEGIVLLMACCPEAAVPSWLKPWGRWKAESNKQRRIVVGNRASWKSAVFKAGMSGEGARQARRVHGSASGTWTKQDPGQKTVFPWEWDPVDTQLRIWFLQKNIEPKLAFWMNSTALGEDHTHKGQKQQPSEQPQTLQQQEQNSSYSELEHKTWFLHQILKRCLRDPKVPDFL